MTNNEAIARMKYRIDTATHNIGKGADGKAYEDMEMAIKALEEIRRYRSIGTVEECHVAVAKQKGKKPTPIDYERYIGVVNNAKCLRGAYWCPNCKHAIRSGDYCNDCGQAIDWSDTI